MSERNGNGNGNGHTADAAAVLEPVNGNPATVRPDLTEAERQAAVLEWEQNYEESAVTVRTELQRQTEEAELAQQPAHVQAGVNRLRELATPRKKDFRRYSGGQLNSGQYATRYLVRGIVAAGQAGGIFGAFKTLKTSLAADLLISIASGTPFLGRFPVPQPGRVLFLSGESGLPALQSIARRICAERGLSLDQLDNFVVSPDLPRLDLRSDVAALKKLIEVERPVCVVIDPAYLTLGGDNGRNLFAMGSLLRPLAELCESTGCAVLVVHHCKRSQKAGDPATLDDIAWSGFAEFSAEWLLVSRRRPFDPATGHHELWLGAGSRVGNHGVWELDVDEGPPCDLLPAGPLDGPLDEPLDDPLSGEHRVWKTSLRRVASLERQLDAQFVAASEDRRLRRREATVDRQKQRVLEFLAAHPNGCNATQIREVLGFNGNRMKRLLDLLCKDRLVRTTEFRHDRRTETDYHRVPVMDLSATAIRTGRITPPDEMTYEPRSGHFVERRTASPTSGPDTTPSIASPTIVLSPLRPQPGGGEQPVLPAAPPATGAGALPLPGPDTFAERGTEVDRT
jgi:AAA domain